MQQWIDLATTTAAGCRLSFNSFYLISEDAKRWCNGMFSNNIRSLQTAQGNRSAICDDRGRVQGLIDVYCLEEDRFICILDGVDSDWFLQRFNMFLLLDDIEQEELSADLFHICGPSSSEILEQAGFSIPSESLQYSHSNNTHLFRKNRFGEAGFDLITEDIETLKQELQKAGLQLSPQTGFDALRIINGIAKWPDEGNDKTMIHELRMNQECCAFDKGCYVGQEIINRIDIKGILSKKLHRLSITGEAKLGDPLILEGREVGKITSLTELTDQQMALSVIRKKAWSSGTILQIASGGKATVL